MGSAVCDPAARAAIDQLTAGLDALAAAGINLLDTADARTWITDLESLGRRIRAVQIDLLGEIDDRGLHATDGHRSGKIFIRHVGRLSNAEAGRRAQAHRALRSLSAVRIAYTLGYIGSDHLDRIARLYANTRVRAFIPAQEAELVRLARQLSYRDFDNQLSTWERLMDEDGTADRAQRNHENRDFNLRQNFDTSWNITGGCGSLQGVELNSIFHRFYQLELDADWAKARAQHGPDATVTDLHRTDKQRRADTLHAIFQTAAHNHATTPGGSKIVTHIVFDSATFERWIRIASGAPVAPLDIDLDLQPATTTNLAYRCSDLDGHPIHPREALAAALTGHIARTIIGADSIIIDKGRRQRLFTGAAAEAIRTTATTCFMPGCETPVSMCQIDHLKSWIPHAGEDPDDPGTTDIRNGAPACAPHNRTKYKGWTSYRDHNGKVHIFRPDGTELE